MPIYDFDGSTSREIGKLYDWNGSTNSQIKEVYDFDGTTSRLIYKDAPDYLFNLGDNAEITGGWSVKKWVLSGSANGIIVLITWIFTLATPEIPIVEFIFTQIKPSM